MRRYAVVIAIVGIVIIAVVALAVIRRDVVGGWERGVHVTVAVSNETTAPLNGLALVGRTTTVPFATISPGATGSVEVNEPEVNSLRLRMSDGSSFDFLGALPDTRGISGSVLLEISQEGTRTNCMVIETTVYQPGGLRFGTGDVPGGVYPAMQQPPDS
ncbi:hypothetical protein FDZ71_00325 [bacterium]|nr:MAG: hypothetical protein FDZ71_00325 [bacterium]